MAEGRCSKDLLPPLPPSPDAEAFLASIVESDEDSIAHPAPDAESTRLEALGLQPQDLASLSVAEIEEALGAPCSETLLAVRSKAVDDLSKLALARQTGHIKRFFPAAPQNLRTGKPKKAARAERSPQQSCAFLYLVCVFSISESSNSF